jgi:UDP-N-acetylmuramoylalanine--D-glutamate ligase
VKKSLNGGAGEPGLMLEGITQVETMEQAVEAAANLAQSGDVVLLSPGGTSFDAFQDFAERGDRFKELVGDLSGRERWQ